MNFRRPSVAILFFIAVINLYFLIAVRLFDHSGTNWQTVIYSDGKGYYEYLRAAFINHNLSNPEIEKAFIRNSDSGPMIKFFGGTAIAQLPFFLIAFIISIFRSQATDGYTFEFQLMIAIAGYFYLLLGLIWLRKLLLQFFSNDIIVAVTLFVIAYGTNLFYYAVLEPSMSHVYAFSFACIFLFEGYAYFKSFRIRNLIASSIAFGLIILIRPTNVVILLMLPVICSNWISFFQFLKNYRHVIFSIIIVAGILFIQPLLWKLQTGSWFVWSYQGEGFYFSNPAITEVLFSFNKGWFVYTPIALVAMLGFISIWKMKPAFAISIFFTVLTAIYFTASWWCWNYGDSFGMRPMIDFYPLIALLIAALFSSVKKNAFKTLLSAVMILLVSVSCIQTYQYYKKILQHYSMDAEKYKFIFLKTSDDDINILGGNIDLMPYTTSEPALIAELSNNFVGVLPIWNPYELTIDPIDSLNTCCLLDSSFNSLECRLPASAPVRLTQMLYIEVSLRRMELSKHSSSASQFVAKLKNVNETVFNYQFALNDFPDEDVLKWRTFHYAFRIRKQVRPFNIVSFQIFNPALQKFLIDDVKIKISSVE
ncbi:MAG: hypothetical protein LH473_09675 [Chitinophagales bacterium]|nr:hypothetical protein [Chitinophagales bacterium]